MPVRRGATDPAGRLLGMVVFLIGVAMLIAVFFIAYRDLIASSEGIFQRMLNLPVTLMFKAGLLLVMGIAASAIANKGIALYAAARLVED
jgi:heme/copper-type cytochrome/quinol oxidase subunit 3